MIITLGVIILALGILAFFLTLGKKSHAKEGFVQKDIVEGPKTGHCPICNTALYGKEKVISRVFEGGNEKDRRCNILGCPHCHPVLKGDLRRRCPVCKKDVSENGYLLARMFLRKDGSQHVHVVGCTECHKKT